MKIVEIDRSKQLSQQPHTGHNRWHPDIPAIIEADPGEEVVFGADARFPRWTIQRDDRPSGPRPTQSGSDSSAHRPCSDQRSQARRSS